MLLFVMRGAFRRPLGPRSWRPTRAATRANAGALFAAGLFVVVWCSLRLLAARRDGFGVDVALAFVSLAVGLWAVRRGAKTAGGAHS